MFKENTRRQVIFLIFTLVLVALFYVWQRVQVYRLGYEIRSLLNRIEELKEENNHLIARLSILTSPQYIIEKVEEYGLELSPPSREKVRVIDGR